ncbi:uncharacterized protein LOC116346857 [Contarinia nasturtii]|uniref:uncharacterized protein LOC116346857 n=1 Tax=Contarinia nasturtii TaxID=265458 RepID=UPI0012D42F4E|nr:uncharacterized protein LOC116346857 [Contarinia nasturtii]
MNQRSETEAKIQSMITSALNLLPDPQSEGAAAIGSLLSAGAASLFSSGPDRQRSQRSGSSTVTKVVATAAVGAAIGYALYKYNELQPNERVQSRQIENRHVKIEEIEDDESEDDVISNRSTSQSTSSGSNFEPFSRDSKFHIVDTLQECRRVVKELRLHCIKYKVLGIGFVLMNSSDNDRKEIALLQLASYHNNVCGVFHLSKLKHIPIELEDLLQDVNIIKVGENIIYLKSLLEYRGENIESIVNLRDVALLTSDLSSAFPYLSPYDDLRLEKMSSDYLGVSFDESIQNSNWNAMTLSKEQIYYAAQRALVAIDLFKYFAQILKPTESFENQYDHIKCIIANHNCVENQQIVNPPPILTTGAPPILSPIENQQSKKRSIKKKPNKNNPNEKRDDFLSQSIPFRSNSIHEFPDDSKIYVVNTILKCRYVTKELQLHCDNMLGVDFEPVSSWGDGSKEIASLQLATRRGLCAIFRLKELKHVPLELQKLLNRTDIIKVGGNLSTLKKLLHDNYDDHVTSTFDVRYMRDMAGFSFSGGLEKMSNKYLGVSFEKTIQNSNWNAATLSEEQIQYAAEKALVAVELFKYFAKKIEADDSFQNESEHLKYIIDIHVRKLLNINYEKNMKIKPQTRGQKNKIMSSVLKNQIVGSGNIWETNTSDDRRVYEHPLKQTERETPIAHSRIYESGEYLANLLLGHHLQFDLSICFLAIILKVTIFILNLFF